MAGTGGKRAGSGRKPHRFKGIIKQLPPDSAALVLSEINAQKKWVQLANSDDERIALDTMKYLSDRAYGKPKQAVEMGGPNGGPIPVEILDDIDE